MDFRQLQYICTVAELHSVTKAAAALYITQPSLSHFIAKTEAELGVKLFDRTTSPLSLTYAGEQYVKSARQILKLSDGMAREFRDISQNMKGRIRVGMPYERAAYMLPLLLPRYRQMFPGIEVQLFTANGARLVDSIDKGRTDFIILPYHTPENHIASSLIYRERLMLVASRDMLPEGCIITDEKAPFADPSCFKKVPFILVRRGHVIREALEALFGSTNLQVVMETDSNMTAYRLAASGIGAAVVPEMTLSLTKCPWDAVTCPLGNPPLQWDVHAFFHKEAYLGVAEQSFLQLAREVFGSSNP